MAEVRAQKSSDCRPESVDTRCGTEAEAQALEIDLSIVVPVYNEAHHLERWCRELLSFNFDISCEFVFVDDASTDGSREIVERLAVQDPRTLLLCRSTNQGKGAALRLGFTAARGRFVVVQDADYEYSFADIPKVLAPLLSDTADVVYGSRYAEPSNTHRPVHYAANRTLTVLSNLLTGLRLTDMETCYKAFRGDIIRNIELRSPRFGFEPEITAKLASLGVRIAEVPIRYRPRNQREGKKIRWTDGVAALWHIARFNLARRELQESTQGVPATYRRA